MAGEGVICKSCAIAEVWEYDAANERWVGKLIDAYCAHCKRGDHHLPREELTK